MFILFFFRVGVDDEAECMQLHMRSVSDPLDDFNRTVVEHSSIPTTTTDTTVATAVLVPTNNNRNGWIEMSDQSHRVQNSSLIFGGGNDISVEQISTNNLDTDSRNSQNSHETQGSDCGLLMVFFVNLCTLQKKIGKRYWGNFSFIFVVRTTHSWCLPLFKSILSHC